MLVFLPSAKSRQYSWGSWGNSCPSPSASSVISLNSTLKKSNNNKYPKQSSNLTLGITVNYKLRLQCLSQIFLWCFPFPDSPSPVQAATSCWKEALSFGPSHMDRVVYEVVFYLFTDISVMNGKNFWKLNGFGHFLKFSWLFLWVWSVTHGSLASLSLLNSHVLVNDVCPEAVDFKTIHGYF